MNEWAQGADRSWQLYSSLNSPQSTHIPEERRPLFNESRRERATGAPAAPPRYHRDSL